MRSAEALRRVAAVAAALLLGPLAQGGGAAACPGVKRSGAWSTITTPFPSWAAGFGVGFTRGGPDTLYAAGSNAVQRSADGGCTWQVAVSLDTLTAPLLPTVTTPYQFVSLAVGPPAGGRPAPVWALAVETTASAWSVALPVLVVSSKDGGKTWARHEAAPADVANGYPRCTWASRIAAGAQPGTAYVYCDDFSMANTVPVVHCRTSLYVTKDWGATWPAVFGGKPDPGQAVAGPTTLGCPPLYALPPVADRYQPGTVWLGLSDGVLRSTKDGAGAKVFVPWPGGQDYLADMDLGVLPSGKPLVLLVTSTWLLSSAGGKATPFASLPLRASERGKALGGELLERSERVLVPYLDGEGHGTAWLYDLGRRTWKRLPPPPPRADKTATWRTYGLMEMADDPASPYVYVRQGSDGTVLRYAR
jgi:hypothetical protein